MYKKLRLILGDQLNINHSWFKENDGETLYVLMEIKAEQEYVKHHIQKVIGFFLAMRAFAQIIENQGFIVKYFKLDDADNAQSFEHNILNLIQRNGIQNFEYQLPDEYRLDVLLKNLKPLPSPPQEGESLPQLDFFVKAYDTEHFLSTRDDLATLFKGKKTYLMETFYRKMRVKYNILMEIDGKTPLSNRWNFDAENRQKLHKTITLPQPMHFFRDVSEMVLLLKKMNIETIGNVENDRFDCTTSTFRTHWQFMG